MRSISRIIFIAAMMVCAGVQAEIINHQEAIEASDIKVNADASGHGRVAARICGSCKYMRLKLTPESAISVNGKQVSASRAINRHWDGGLVIYDVKSRHVVQLDL